MKPTIGRIVHLYLCLEDDPVAAMVTGVVDGSDVYLTIFPPLKLPGYVSVPVPYSYTPNAGHWTWPPRD